MAKKPAKTTIPEAVPPNAEVGQNQPPDSCADTHTREAGDDFPVGLLGRDEKDPVEVLRKIFDPEFLARQYWRMLSATRTYRRADGSMGSMDDVATQLRALESLIAYIAGKPALALPAAPKADAPTDDLASLVEAAKVSPMMRARLAARIREQLAELEKKPEE
jgi:hypothetical protein